MTQSYQTIRFAKDGRILRITLNRPDKRNALSPEMLEELVDAFEKAEEDKDACVIILRGEGQDAFCAGADLGGMAGGENFIDVHEARG
ncbi:MAG: enoyl-CoA hydratase/isomerase family protein, partial [Myxococcota bacterium]